MQKLSLYIYIKFLFQNYSVFFKFETIGVGWVRKCLRAAQRCKPIPFWMFSASQISLIKEITIQANAMQIMQLPCLSRDAPLDVEQFHHYLRSCFKVQPTITKRSSSQRKGWTLEFKRADLQLFGKGLCSALSSLCRPLRLSWRHFVAESTLNLPSLSA